MKIIHCTIKGVAPLLQHRFPEEEHGENKKRGKKQVYLAEEEALKSAYTDGDGKIVQPSEHIFGALVKAGVSFKFEGKKTFKDIIKGGLIIEPELLPLLDSKGEQYVTWDEIDSRNVVVQRSRVIRWRPKFNNWSIKFDITVLDDENIDCVTLKDIVEKAGNVGLGDYRPRYGRFQVVNWEFD